MKKHLSRITAALLCLLLLTAAACGSKDSKKAATTGAKAVALPVDTALQSRLKKFCAQPRVKGHFGLYVYDLTAGKPVTAVDIDHAQPVASCTKLLASVAALNKLGANYTYRTTLYTRGKVEKDTLRGDIMLKAGLDPMLKAEDLTRFTGYLRSMGIRYIDGKCLLSLKLKEKVKAEQHWYPWDLSFSSYGILFKGPEAIGTAMKRALAASGIRMSGDCELGAPSSKEAKQWTGRFRYLHPVSAVTRLMWKNSSNTKATSLLYTLGYAVDPHGNGSADALANAGVSYVRAFLRDSLKMRDTALVIHDGCGLCTHNHLSPRALVAVLAFGYHHKPIYEQLMRNLSVSGVDGTLRHLLYDPRLKGRIHGKTGTLSHPFGISSLAGYCKGADGHDLCFAFLNSEMSVLDAHVLQRKLCLLLVGGK